MREDRPKQTIISQTFEINNLTPSKLLVLRGRTDLTFYWLFKIKLDMFKAYQILRVLYILSYLCL